MGVTLERDGMPVRVAGLSRFPAGWSALAASFLALYVARRIFSQSGASIEGLHLHPLAASSRKHGARHSQMARGRDLFAETGTRRGG